MLTFTDFLLAVVEFMPLFVVLDLIPTLIASIVDDYVVRKCLLKQAGQAPKPQAILSYSPLMPKSMYPGQLTQLYTYGVFVILVAPFVEEIVFRGVPLMIHPLLAWVGTIGWALAHPIKAVTTLETCPHERKLAILNAATLAGSFLASGVFYMLVWLRGLEYGAVAISYHAFHNASIFFGNLIQAKLASRKKKSFAKRKVTQPVMPPVEPGEKAPVARRVLRYVGLENSVSPATGEREEAYKIAHAIEFAKTRRRRILREV
ncbi:MAG: hypothetical protein DRJ47_10260 [Thermoprotei archaeon]|nr:MAG: hypothetical protein DRJ47_10260 [Thermoprotei archaeon]